MVGRRDVLTLFFLSPLCVVPESEGYRRETRMFHGCRLGVTNANLFFASSVCRTGVCGVPKTSRCFSLLVAMFSLTHWFFLLCVWYRIRRGTEESFRLFHGCWWGVISVRFSFDSSVCRTGVCGVSKTLLVCFMVVRRGSLLLFRFASPVAWGSLTPFFCLPSLCVVFVVASSVSGTGVSRGPKTFLGCFMVLGRGSLTIVFLFVVPDFERYR